MADGLRQSVLDGKWTTQCYADKLGRHLHADNSGSLQWGDKYREFHLTAWQEARRVLSPNGILILNIKDHVRNGAIQPVTTWHIQALKSLGFDEMEHEMIVCPGMRYGQNSEKRVQHESVIKLQLRK